MPPLWLALFGAFCSFFISIVRLRLRARWTHGGRAYPDKFQSIRGSFHIGEKDLLLSLHHPIPWQTELSEQNYFFSSLSFLQDFLLAQLHWVERWHYLLRLSLLTEITTLAEVLKQKQVLAFLQLTSAYENFSNSAVKGINSLQKVKLWTNAKFSSKPGSSFPVGYASTSCSSSL